MKIDDLFSLIEKAAAGAAEAINPTEPGVAKDIGLGLTLFALIEQLIPHAKNKMTNLQNSGVNAVGVNPPAVTANPQNPVTS
jgi:hypothetical protein